jgi:hypothetical protein
MYLTEQEVAQLKDYIGNNLTVNQGTPLMQFFLNKEAQQEGQEGLDKEIADANPVKMEVFKTIISKEKL